MFTRSTISVPVVNQGGRRGLFWRKTKIKKTEIQSEILILIEALAIGDLTETQDAHLRSYIYSHYHPELRIGTRVHIYQAVKESLEDGNLNQLKDIAGIRQKSAYINTITNVGKRSSYFGGLIGITVVGYFLLPPIIKVGVLPVAKSAIRKFIPTYNHLTPIDKSLKLSSLVGKAPHAIYKGICAALGRAVKKAGKPINSEIDTTPMDDLIGNLFFRSLIEQSSFSESAKADFRKRAQIAFIHDMAHVSRQLEGLAQNPDLCWERIYHYTNFAMFLKSMESKEVPVQSMLHNAVDIISRANIGSKKKDLRFYIEFERGLKHLNYVMQVVEPLDKFNEKDDFDEIESRDAKLAFFEQNRQVMERLYYGHEKFLDQLTPMFSDFKKAASENPKDEQLQAFQSKIKGIIHCYRKPFKQLGNAELVSYNEELRRLGS